AESVERPGGAAFGRRQEERAVVEGARNLLRDAAATLVGLVHRERFVVRGAKQIRRPTGPSRNGKLCWPCVVVAESFAGCHCALLFPRQFEAFCIVAALLLGRIRALVVHSLHTVRIDNEGEWLVRSRAPQWLSQVMPG